MDELSKVQIEQIQILDDLLACGYDLAELGLPVPESLRAKWQAENKAAAASGDGRDSPEQRERNLIRDVGWVYQNLHDPTVKFSDAPSAGAWGMREAFKDDPAEFYKSFLPKVLNRGATNARGDQVEAEIERCERKSIAELKDFLREAVEVSQL